MDRPDIERVRAAARALAALHGETLTEEQLARMTPNLERGLASLAVLRALDLEGFEPAYLAPLPKEAPRG